MTMQQRIIAVIPLAWGQEAAEQALAAARQVAHQQSLACAVLALGPAPAAWLTDMAGAAGAVELVYAVHAALSDGENLQALAEAAAQALDQSGQQLLLLPPGSEGEELGARLAACLSATWLGRCARLDWKADGLEFERACWGGRLTLRLQIETSLAVACLRAGKLQQQPAHANVLEPLIIELGKSLPAMFEIEQSSSGQTLPPVESARIVVSGGRGVNEAGFALLEQLAMKLGGSLGGSLPAVDAGMLPVMRQVGVSGKFVSPDVYLAVGISGTPQHLAGISHDSRIVAINSDPAADIFKVANLGAVVDWEQMLPALLERLPA